MTTQAPDSLRCSRHRGTPTSIRCASCGLPFCRECVVNRFITSRSSVWVCAPCAGVRRPASSHRTGPRGAPSIIGRPGSAPRRARYWWIAGAAALLLCAAYAEGALPL